MRLTLAAAALATLLHTPALAVVTVSATPRVAILSQPTPTSLYPSSKLSLQITCEGAAKPRRSATLPPAA